MRYGACNDNGSGIALSICDQISVDVVLAFMFAVIAAAVIVLILVGVVVDIVGAVLDHRGILRAFYIHYTWLSDGVKGNSHYLQVVPLKAGEQIAYKAVL